MTRLLKTPIIGRSAETVASSWIDMLAGLSGLYSLRMPPGFCASAGATADAAATQMAAAIACHLYLIGALRHQIGQTWCSPGRAASLPVEPQIFVAIAVVDAVDHDGQALHLGVTAGGLARVE